MVNRFARLATGRPKAILIVAFLVFLIAGATTGDVAEHLTVGGFVDNASESHRAADILDKQFDTGAPNVVLLVTARSGDVDSPDVAAAGAALTSKLAEEPGVDGVASYWSENNAPPLRSADGTRALVVGRIDSASVDVVNDRITELAPQLRAAGDGTAVKVEVGGFAEIYRELGATVEKDLVTAEVIALPITLILLVLIFGSVAAGFLPLATAALSVVGTMVVLRLLALVTDVSVFSLSLTTALGLGLAIDYSLFIVARYREELKRTPDDPRGAVTRTVQTAGRTVAFSSLTVAASLCAMLLFPLSFLKSFAYAGVAVALLAGVFSLIVLPAILALLGHKVNALTLWKRSVNPPEEGVWHRVATVVMKRPLPVATGIIVVLLFLGAPFLGLHLTQPDERVLSESSRSRQVHDVIRQEFSSTEEGALSVVAPSANGASDEVTTDYAVRLAQLPGVARVDAAGGSYCGTGMVDEFGCAAGDLLVGPEGSPRYAGFKADGGTYLSVVPSVAPLSDAGETLVKDVRDTTAPFPVLVTGPGAELIDTNASLFNKLPLALGVIAAVTVVLLFMMFGSVVIPIKAVALNLLSLSATFGAMVWVFQEGHLSGLLGFTATGGISAEMPIMMFCIAFGLSMDYEVFLLARIKEEHDRGASNTTAVALGLERTGRIVTAAAVLMSVVFLAFVSSHVSFIKLYGVGLTLAVLLDAFVIRGTLVPAFMRLAGNWNWWAPGPLRRFYERYGISDHGADLPDDGPDVPGAAGPEPEPAKTPVTV
jgi:RND superfamily putative drug exporter